MTSRTPLKKESVAGASPSKISLDRNVRRSIGEWEAVNSETATSKLNTTQTQSGTVEKRATKPKMTSTPTTSNKTFIKTPPPVKETYKNRTSEARACLTSAKLHLKNSRNIKTEIKEEVTKALCRLYALVKEAEAGTGKAEEGREKPEVGMANKADASTSTDTLAQIPVNQERIISVLEKHAIAIAQNTAKMIELGTQIDSHNDAIKQIPAVTYASAVASKAPQQRRDTLHSVVVSSSNETETGEAILSRIREAVDAKEGWVKVERVRKAKDRKVIMGFGTKQERDKVKDRLSRRTADLVVEDIRNKDPLLVLKNVLTINSDEDVVGALRNQNKELFRGLGAEDDRIEVRFRKKLRNPHLNHVVIGTSPVIWRKAIDLGSLHIDLQRVRVEDQTPLVQCTRCLGYGHGRRFCKEPADVCSHCGGPHLRAECADWLSGVQPRCRNCVRQGLEDAEHNVFNEDCPVRKKWDLLARSAVAYC
ncbi:uncharacterized protein [Choristoneura fumiferana]|uniref:uncharacterized protein n=1 Tax=Choristoneura fumiferana TaxID=7141 RepID=UPI003D15632D